MNSGLVRVGDLLPDPIFADPMRPNEDGHATPIGADPEYGYDPSRPGVPPLYSVMKRCVTCATVYIGLSFMPQYDDDEVQNGYCAPCLDARDHLRAEQEREETLRSQRGQRHDREQRAEEWALERQARREAAQRLGNGEPRPRPSGFTR